MTEVGRLEEALPSEDLLEVSQQIFFCCLFCALFLCGFFQYPSITHSEGRHSTPNTPNTVAQK